MTHTQPLRMHMGERPHGVSLVTCCKNRNENLLRALPSWLARPEISEIVIVDWDSDTPVARDIADAGLSDERIRIARVFDEPRWILSYAFNIGFRLARFSQVLKTDADIVVDETYFERNHLEHGQFIAGNWRVAEAGQQFVNGFFHVHHDDLMRVNGFNEYITTYGWDDDDLYDRMSEENILRKDVAPNTVHHLDHDDSQRLNERSATDRDGWQDLNDATMFKIRTNRFIATIMPRWSPHRTMMPYSVSTLSDGTMGLLRNGPSLHVVPDHIAQQTKQLAAYELVSWQAGVRSFDLTPAQLDMLLSSHRLYAITSLRVELALAGASQTALMTPRVMVAELAHDVIDAAPHDLARAAHGLAQLAYDTARLLVVRGPHMERPEGLPDVLAAAPYLTPQASLGPLHDVALHDVHRDQARNVIRLHIGVHDLHALHVSEETPDQPATDWITDTLPPIARTDFDPASPYLTAPVIPKLYLDAQHGLGNRLRAIGSAHAVAQATERELVIIWEPDHHCLGKLSDLFDYNGPVIEQSFLADAQAAGATVLNYMEIEEGAAKDAPLTLTPERDAYIRSAYVINHPASDWNRDNLFLQSLTPTAHVRDILAGAGAAADIGLHIRMEGAPGTDLQSYDSVENWTEESHAAIVHWREKSHFKHFMTRLDALIADNPDARVFLAADQPETYRAFARTYGDRVAMLERTLYDRSAEQLLYALADMLALSQVKHLLGSNWSSFTEGALRLATRMETHEVAGRDF